MSRLRSIDYEGERYAHIGDLLADFDRLRAECMADGDLFAAAVMSATAKIIVKTYNVDIDNIHKTQQKAGA